MAPLEKPPLQTFTMFVEDASNKALAELVASVMTVLLRQMAWTGVVYGLLIIAVLLAAPLKESLLSLLVGAGMVATGCILVAFSQRFQSREAAT